MNPEMTVDLTDPAFIANPYPFYAQLRKSAPVYPVSMPDGRTMWLVTRYQDALALLKDERLVKSPATILGPEELAQFPPMPDALKPLSRQMLDLDGDDHRRLRSLVHKVFTPGLIEQMRGRVTEIAEALIAGALPHGEMELIRDFAYPLPITVICEILGVTLADRMQFREWSNAFVNQSLFATDMEQAMSAVTAMTAYLRAMIAERRATPGDDLIGNLIQVEEQGDMLNEDELLAMIFLLMIAGHETTVNLIGNGTLALLTHPDQMEKLRREPGLMKSAIEELLRYDSPVASATERYAREDMVLHGASIARGDTIIVSLAAANRDPAQFENPDTLDLARADNRHLAFGQGVHYCLGAPLARLEGTIALRLLLERLPNLRLAVSPDALEYNAGLTLRGLKALPVAF